MDYLRTLQTLHVGGQNSQHAATEVFTYLTEHHPEHAASWAINMLISIADPTTVDVANADELVARPKLAYSLKEASEQVSISRSSLYKWLLGGGLGAVKAGGTTLIPGTELVSWLQNLPSWEPESPHHHARRPRYT